MEPDLPPPPAAAPAEPTAAPPMDIPDYAGPVSLCLCLSLSLSLCVRVRVRVRVCLSVCLSISVSLCSALTCRGPQCGRGAGGEAERHCHPDGEGGDYAAAGRGGARTGRAGRCC